MPSPVSVSSVAPRFRIPGWTVEGILAEGGQSRVVRVYRTGDAERRGRAAKVFRLRGRGGEAFSAEEQRWRLRREVMTLREMEHAGCPGATRVLDHGMRMEESPHPWLVMPLHSGGAMREEDVDGAVTWAEPYCGNVGRVLEIAAGLARTLAFMHRHRRPCLHRDVNTRNVLLDAPGGPPVLADFGLARPAGFPARPGSDDGAVSGAWRWRPPELDSGGEETPACDVFMLGGLIYEALSGGRFLPPAAEWGGEWPHEQPEYSLPRLSGDRGVRRTERLLRRLLAPKPEARPSAADAISLCRRVLHPSCP